MSYEVGEVIDNEVLRLPKHHCGQFLFDQVDFCSFVINRGKFRGRICQKQSQQSTLLGRFVPACLQHLSKYEEMVILHSNFTQPLRPGMMTESYEEFFTPAPPPPRLQKRKFILSSIPMAIARSKECTVCLEQDDPLLMPCGHTVCFGCVIRLKKDSCPVCRDLFKKEQLRRL